MQDSELFLLCRVGQLLCALPLQYVEETMRPLAVEGIAGVPSFVCGVAIVRGAPIPVIESAVLLSGHASHATRFVTVKAGGRRIALAVDAVVGVARIPLSSLDALPPLFQDASIDVISAIGRLDAQLLLVLQGARFISEELWAAFDAGCVLA